MKRKIAMFNLPETTRDARVRRIAGSLAATGSEVFVLGQTRESKVRRQRCDNFEILRVDGPKDFGVREMAALEARSPDAGRVLRACGGEVMDRDLGTWRHLGHKARRRLVRYAHRIEQRLERDFVPERADRTGRASDIMLIRSLALMNLRLAEAANALEPDIVHCNDLDSLLAGFIVSKWRDIPLVYDAHEVYAEQPIARLRSPYWQAFYKALDRALLPHTALRFTVCEAVAEHFQEAYQSAPFVTVRNMPRKALLPSEDHLARKNSPRVLLYHGALFDDRGLDEIVLAAHHVDAQFVLRGFGGHETALRRLVSDQRLGDKVHFAAPVPVDDLVKTAAEADVGLCPFVSTSLNTRFALPNKFFEYMMAGLAVASSDLVELRRHTDALDVGILFEQLTTESMADGLNQLLSGTRLDEFRERSYTLARDRYHWEAEQHRLLDPYEQI